MILLNGTPVTAAVTLVLEDQDFNVVQEINTLNGEYSFENLPASPEGYNVLFTQERNPQYTVDQVASWAWIGPLPVQDGDVIHPADMEIGLQGFQQMFPPPYALLNMDPVTSENPLVFEWTPYPSATLYWLELRSGRTLELIWQSDFLDTNTITFDGVLANGEKIPSGSYWWNVSARIEDALVTISGPLTSFALNP